MPPSPAPSLEPGGHRPSNSPWKWIQRLYRRVSGTLQATLSLTQTLPVTHPSVPCKQIMLARKLSQTKENKIKKQNNFLVLMCTQQILSLLYELPFTIRIRKTKLGSKSIVSDLCSCWSLNVGTWESRPGLLCQRYRIMSELVFMGSEKSYLHVLLLEHALESDLDRRKSL